MIPFEAFLHPLFPDRGHHDRAVRAAALRGRAEARDEAAPRPLHRGLQRAQGERVPARQGRRGGAAVRALLPVLL